MRLFGLGILAGVLVGCSSSSIKIDSNPPGADVYLRTVGASERKLVGKTPIARTEMAEFQKGINGSMMIDLEKESFMPISILVTETSGSDIEISQNLKPSMGAAGGADAERLNKNLDQLFEAQRLARVGRLDDALKVLDDVGKAFPQLSSVPEMKGGIFVLQKNYDKALDEFRRVLAMSSDNASAQQMVKRLESKYGAKGTTPTQAPAATPPAAGASQ